MAIEGANVSTKETIIGLWSHSSPTFPHPHGSVSQTVSADAASVQEFFIGPYRKL